MTIKLSKIVATNSGGQPVFLQAMESLRGTRQSAKSCLWLIQFSRKCQTLFTDFHNVRNALVAQYGDVTKKPGEFIIPPEKVDELNAELTSLEMDIDLDIPRDIRLKMPAECVVEQLETLLDLDIFEAHDNDLLD